LKYPILVVLTVVIALSPGYGEMYRWVDEKGTVHFADDLSNVPERFRSDAETRKTPKEAGSPERSPDKAPPVMTSTAQAEDMVIPLYRRHELWLTEVLLNGRVKRHFILDSGASFTLINWQTANELGFVVDEYTPYIPVATVSGQIMTPLVTLKSVQVGGADAENVEALIYNMPSESAGLLGNSFLNRFKVTIDTNNERLVLSGLQGPSSPDRPGGLGRDYWVGQFRYYSRIMSELKNMKAKMEARGGQSELNRVNNAIRYFENQLGELERKASNAGVPRNWRE
jgi:clan AA aspartic protease (TIGR02281 family)